VSSLSGKAGDYEYVKLFLLRNMIFSVEHVLERIKIEAQKHPNQSSITSIKDLWKLKGLKGYNEGLLANGTRRLAKESYQMPLTIKINKFWKQHFPEEYNKDNLPTNLLTGLSVASLVQTGLTLPIDRLLIEKTAKEGYLPFLRRLKFEGVLKGVPVLYEGCQVTLIRHSFVWTTFFLSNNASTHLVKKLDSENRFSNLSWLARALLTSTMVVTIAYPLELLRNRVLMEPELLDKGNFKAITTLCNRYGLRNMYRGAPIVFFHNNIQVIFMQALYDRMNKK
jgi:hypothetical protein